MKEKDLLNAFLNGFPESYHPYDRERFLNYAIECAKNGNSMDSDEFRKHGLKEDLITEYEIAFGWIKDTYEMLANSNFNR